MKILIASGIFTPEVGGPATYIPQLAEELIQRGHQLLVLTYSGDRQNLSDQNFPYQVVRIKRSGNKLSNYWRYYRAIKSFVKDYDVIYAFDHFSAGLPAALVAKKYHKPLFIRVGGDFIWERYLERSGRLVTLQDFYQQGLHTKKENLRFRLIKWIFRQAQGIIFSTDFQKNIFKKYYDLTEGQLHLVSNPRPAISQPADRTHINKEIIFAGRFIHKNNVKNLIAAFRALDQHDYKLIMIGAGPLKKDLLDWVKDSPNIKIEGSLGRLALARRLSSAYLVVFPSLTDISPNAMLESLALGVPFISTAEIGFDWLKKQIKTFDPTNIEDMTAVLKAMLDVKVYNEYSQRLKQIRYDYNYSQAAEDTIRILQS